jgi:hypothetical protein
MMMRQMKVYNIFIVKPYKKKKKMTSLTGGLCHFLTYFILCKNKIKDATVIVIYTTNNLPEKKLRF